MSGGVRASRRTDLPQEHVERGRGALAALDARLVSGNRLVIGR